MCGSVILFEARRSTSRNAHTSEPRPLSLRPFKKTVKTSVLRWGSGVAHVTISHQLERSCDQHADGITPYTTRLTQLDVRLQLLSTDCDRRNLLLTIAVGWVDNTCGMTPCRVEHEAGQLPFTVAICQLSASVTISIFYYSKLESLSN